MPFKKKTFSFTVADVVYVYGFCDGNAVHAVAEYQWRFSNRGMPTRRASIRVYQTLLDAGTLFGLHIAAESRFWR